MSTKRAIYDVAEFKALPSDDGRGRFEALVSVFGNVDVQGDRVMEGAFQKSLEEWKASGAPIPIIWSHQWGNPEAHIGSARPEDVTEVKGKGLKVAGTIDLDDAFGAKVYKLLKERRVREFSFGYEVRKEQPGKDGANELTDLGIIEVGPTLKGANPSTELLSIKADLEEAAAQVPFEELVVRVPEEFKKWTAGYVEAALAELELAGFSPDFKAGRSISSKNEARIRTAVESLTEVLASLGGADEETAEDADEAKVKTEEPKVVDPGLLALQAQIMQLKE